MHKGSIRQACKLVGIHQSVYYYQTKPKADEPHSDCARDEEDITVLYYVNDQWDYRWGGETLFYEDGETKLAFLPAPGRFLLFWGAIEHKGCVPSRICKVSRFTLAMKYSRKSE